MLEILGYIALTITVAWAIYERGRRVGAQEALDATASDAIDEQERRQWHEITKRSRDERFAEEEW